MILMVRVIGHVKIEAIFLCIEIPNDIHVYTTLSENLIGCSTLSQRYCKLIGWYWIIMRAQL